MASRIQPPVVTNSGQQRLKLTTACETCRKRKARCSGDAPCLLCRKNSLRCEFNHDRQKRGPRPKTDSPRPKIDSHQPLSGTTTTPSKLPFVSSIDLASVAAVPSGVTSNSLPQEAPEQAEDALEVRRSLQDAVLKLLENDESFPGETKPSLSLVYHLLDVFWSHVKKHQVWVFDPDEIKHHLIQGDCSQAFLYAICAVSVKFSRHYSVLSSSKMLHQKQFSSYARRRILAAPGRGNFLERVQTLSILALYEIGEADGTQAWCDISTAHSLMRVAIAGSFLSTHELKNFDLTYGYIRLLERELCLGHSLTPSVMPLSSWKTNPHRVLDAESSLPSGDVDKVLDLLLQIQTFSRKTQTKIEPPSWSVDSEFNSYRQSLDKYMLCHLDEIQLTSETLTEALFDGKSKFQSLHCSLVWHCCVISLNLVYLPIQVAAEAENMTNGIARSSGEDRLLNFPLAPKPFLMERIRACESSASIICDICKDIMSCDYFLLPPFMGYCCFQSSVVLINQLRRSRDFLDPNVVEDLKVNFTILGAMRELYAPAEIWVDTLFEIHQLEACQPHGLDINDVFANYYARFDTIKEPPYVPFETCRKSPTVSPDNSLSGTTRETTAPTLQRGFDAPTKNTPPEVWLSDYQSCLQSHILDLDRDSTHKKADQPLQRNDMVHGNATDEIESGSKIAAETNNSQENMNHTMQNHDSLHHSYLENHLNRSTHPAEMRNRPAETAAPPVTGAWGGGTASLSSNEHNQSSSDGMRSTTQQTQTDRYLMSDLNFPAFIDAGAQMLPPLLYYPYQDGLDWMLPNMNDDMWVDQW